MGQTSPVEPDRPGLKAQLWAAILGEFPNLSISQLHHRRSRAPPLWLLTELQGKYIKDLAENRAQ